MNFIIDELFRKAFKEAVIAESQITDIQVMMSFDLKSEVQRRFKDKTGIDAEVFQKENGDWWYSYDPDELSDNS